MLESFSHLRKLDHLLQIWILSSLLDSLMIDEILSYLPAIPNWCLNSPVLSKIWIRWLLVSATTISSSTPRQKPCGELNCPLPGPSWPNLHLKVSILAENAWSDSSNLSHIFSSNYWHLNQLYLYFQYVLPESYKSNANPLLFVPLFKKIAPISFANQHMIYYSSQCNDWYAQATTE